MLCAVPQHRSCQRPQQTKYKNHCIRDFCATGIHILGMSTLRHCLEQYFEVLWFNINAVDKRNTCENVRQVDAGGAPMLV